MMKKLLLLCALMGVSLGDGPNICILGPQKTNPNSNQNPQASDLQQRLAADAPPTTLNPIPGLSDDITAFLPESTLNRPNPNRSPSRSFDEQQSIPIQPPTGSGPNGPVYDRSGFRREPAHPAFGPPDSPNSAPRSNDGTIRNRNGWNRFSTTPSPFDPQPNSTFSEPPFTTNFFDPTRAPTSRPQNNFFSPTTPMSRSNTIPTPRPVATRPTTAATPSLARERPTSKTRNQKPNESAASRHNESERDGIDREVAEFAYVKQPIATVLDEPDLELDGKPVKFSIMKDALSRIGLLELASGPGPITIFCPTDDAFLALEPEMLQKMQQNPNYLRNTMLRHVVNFDVPPESLKNNIIVPSYSGEPLIINVVQGGKLMLVRGTPIIAATNTENGVIYVLNKVLTEETGAANLLEELAKVPEVSTFYNSILRTNVIKKLQGQGPFTIFAPSNEAFGNLSSVTRQILEFNPSALERVLSYHIVEGAYYGKELEQKESIPAKGDRVEPIKLMANPDNGTITLNDEATIIKADTTTGNGVLHIINSLIFPSDLLTTFKKLEQRTFFHRSPSTTNSPASGLPNLLERSQPRSSSGFFDSPSSSPTSTPSSLFPRPSFGFTGANNRQRNSQLSVNNRPDRANTLNPERNQQDNPIPTLNNGESTSRFYRWLQKAGFLDVLNNTGNNYTVVMPTDRAVNRLPIKYQTSLEKDSKQLESLLMYHIVPGVVNLTRISDEDTLPTVSGKDIRMNRLKAVNPNQNDTFTLSGSTILGATHSPNHKIDFLIVERVMYPPQGSLFDVASKSPILKTLSNLIKTANLESGLRETGPFTLFAPSDEAFEKLSPESLEYLTQDSQSSRAFLLRHIVRPIIFTSRIPLGNSTVIESTTGERLNLTRDADQVKVDGVIIKYADITATNGVVHVIDHVL